MTPAYILLIRNYVYLVFSAFKSKPNSVQANN